MINIPLFMGFFYFIFYLKVYKINVLGYNNQLKRGFIMNNLNLYLENGHKLFFNDTFLSNYKKDIMDFLENTDISYMNNINFAKKMMMSQEIKSNNTIEGINDNIERIDDVIKK